MISEKRLARIAWRRSRAYQSLAATFSPPGQHSASRHSREYTRLFVAPRPLVYPYESMHRGACQRVMADSTLDVVRRYREAGFLIPPTWPELPDHITLELFFMSALAKNEAERQQTGAHERAHALAHLQRRFMEDHLLHWVSEFCEDVLSASPNASFRKAADDLRQLLPRDHDWLVALTAKET
ncbi:MAG: molecular chaperone TorD family protein [candidate division NC10 bacterium]|nr:molecular chaperone TorD family protein [candidate division NC10 bacterium]